MVSGRTPRSHYLLATWPAGLLARNILLFKLLLMALISVQTGEEATTEYLGKHFLVQAELDIASRQKWATDQIL